MEPLQLKQAFPCEKNFTGKTLFSLRGWVCSVAKIEIYVLTRAELLFTLCYEIPCINLLISFTDVLGAGCIKKGSFCPTEKILESKNVGNKMIESKDFSNVSGSVVQLKPQKVELNLIPKYKQKVDFDVSVS